MIIIIGCNGTYRHWSDNERMLSDVWTEVKYSHNYYQIIANYLQLICKPCTDRSPHQPAVHKHQHSTHCRLITDHSTLRYQGSDFLQDPKNSLFSLIYPLCLVYNLLETRGKHELRLPHLVTRSIAFLFH